MRTTGRIMVPGLIAIIALCAGTILIADSRRLRPDVRAQEFQQLVGGLGFGPAVDPADCPFCFDPRLAPSCVQNDGPIPGGKYFCPQHTCSIFYCPSLPPLVLRQPH